MSASKYLYYVAAVITLGTFQFGYNMAELNEPREAMTCVTTKPSISALSECITMADWEYSLVTSIFAVGGLLGALLSNPLGTRYGRRKTLLLMSTLFTLAGIMKSVSPNVLLMVIGRFLSGVGSGASAVVVPLYLDEVAPAEIKGQFGALTQLSICVGILVTQLAGLFLSKPMLWRLILVIGAAIGALQGVMLMSIPESPKYLLSIGNKQAARESLAQLRGSGGDIEDEIREEQPLTTSPTTSSTSEKTSFYTFITSPRYRKSALTVCGLMAAQQLLGINAVIFHGVSLLSTLLPNLAGIINVIISVSNLLITLISSRFFDIVSHKKLLIFSMSGMGTSALLLAAGVMAEVPVLSAVACWFFVASFSMGLGPLPWMVASKVTEFRAVDAAQASGLVVNWLGTFLVAFVVPLVRTEVSFVVFGIVGWAAAGMVWWWVEAY